ncbi:DUF7698 family protein [Fundicoccus culcitae]|uniref:DUF7698 domain-containing protein n=1 Tax=Fundicoccus culcitae TaxID=2969821 RepID=A0ABY5P818_9LACT|nr:hypothetical protein [Fundicoccus culcitae]UUX34877.1 hypothetical protein NRE15_04310 [Fundicoccus culcitae]
MKNIKKLDAIIELLDWRNQGYPIDFLSAYMLTQRGKLQKLNFNDILREGSIEEIVESLEEFGIEEFTITDHSTALMKNLWEFNQRGYEIEGMLELETGNMIYNYNSRGEVPEIKKAILLKKVEVQS